MFSYENDIIVNFDNYFYCSGDKIVIFRLFF